MTRLLPWLLGAALVVALLLGVGYCQERGESAQWARDWHAADSTLRIREAERNAARLAVDTVVLRADSLATALAKAPTVVIRRVPGGTVFVPDTTRPDSVIVIPEPVAARLAFLEGHVLEQQRALADLTAGIEHERLLTDSVETTLKKQIELLQNKPDGWRLVFGAGYAGGYDTQPRETKGEQEQSRFAHGPMLFVGIARPVPFPRIFPRRS